ncbi:hypothetical protein BBP40_003763 [Aspergillus hancockii]|nr:hypothetical protein BBP40_003763 [Aspergillus hancockii]
MCKRCRAVLEHPASAHSGASSMNKHLKGPQCQRGTGPEDACLSIHAEYMGTEDGCPLCGYYRKQVTLSVPSLDEEVAIALASPAQQRPIGGFRGLYDSFCTINKQRPFPYTTDILVPSVYDSFFFSRRPDVRTTNLIDQKIDLSRLRAAGGAAFDSYANRHAECLPGTRMDLLQQIEDWRKAPHGKPIFWLNGMAGTGKSTISRTIAARLKKQQLLGASFFFKRGEEDRGTAKMLFSTLVEQLVIGIPQGLPKVLKAIEDDPKISEKDAREQFEKLLS